MCSKISVESGVVFGQFNITPLEATLLLTSGHLSVHTYVPKVKVCDLECEPIASAFCDWLRNGTRSQPSNNTTCLGFDSWEGAVQEPSPFPRETFSENGANPKNAFGN